MMLRLALLLLFFNISVCYGYGFKSCCQNFPETGTMWCANEKIANLSEVLRMIPVNVTFINLSKNRIEALPHASFFKMHQLQKLHLGENLLVSLKKGAFMGLFALKILNLTSNNISHLHPKAFEDLTSLQTLLLKHNTLQTISSGAFRYLPVIQKVDLSLNRLTDFSCDDELRGSLTLTELNLYANNLSRVNVSCFPSLRHIQLSNNSELTLPAEAFAFNSKLQTLRLQAVKEEVFEGLSVVTKRKLTRVSLSLLVESSLGTICGVLQEMTQLKNLEVCTIP